MTDVYQRDWWVASVIVTEDNNTFRINETGAGGNGVIEITITPGEYWLHRDPTQHTFGVPAMKSLYLAIEAALSLSSAANGYEFEAATPLESPEAGSAGLRFGVNATIQFQIEAGHPNFTMDPEWFGLRAETTVATQAADSTWSVTSPFCRKPTWRTVHQTGGYASDKRSEPTVSTRESHDDAEGRYAIVWRRRRERRIEYQFVPAGSIFAHHMSDDFYAAGERGIGDTGGVLEHVWQCLAENRAVILVHNRDTWDLSLGVDAELVKMQRLSSSFRDNVSRARLNGDLYDVSFNLAILNSTLPGFNH